MDVIDRQARPAVGGEARAEHDLLQRRLTQLRGHRRRERVAAFGVEREEHRVVIAAAGQALLRVEELLLVVVGARGQARDAAGRFRVVSLAAVDLEHAEAVGRARLISDAQSRLAAVGIDLGPADRDIAGRETFGRQVAQGDVLGVVPGLLRERLAGAQCPGGADAVALRPCGGIALDGSGKTDLHRADAGLLARHDGDHDLARRLGVVGRFLELERERGSEVTQGAQKLARVALGCDHETGQLRGAQILDLAIALDFEMPAEVFADGVGSEHLQRKRVARACLGGAARDRTAFGRIGGRGAARQQAASLQEEDT